MSVRICYDTKEKILQQNAFAYNTWSVSHFLSVTSPIFTDFKNCFTSKLNNKSVVK